MNWMESYRIASSFIRASIDLYKSWADPRIWCIKPWLMRLVDCSWWLWYYPTQRNSMETQQSDHAPRFGPEITNGCSRAKNDPLRGIREEGEPDLTARRLIYSLLHHINIERHFPPSCDGVLLGQTDNAIYSPKWFVSKMCDESILILYLNAYHPEVTSASFVLICCKLLLKLLILILWQNLVII